MNDDLRAVLVGLPLRRYRDDVGDELADMIDLCTLYPDNPAQGRAAPSGDRREVLHRDQSRYQAVRSGDPRFDYAMERARVGEVRYVDIQASPADGD